MHSDIIDRLTVRWDERIVGELALDRDGAMQFAYTRDWLDDPNAPQISAALPKQEAAFGDRAAMPFFDGLLPEEWLSYPYGPLYRLLALTGQRESEVRGMTWQELSKAEREWVIPGARTTIVVRFERHHRKHLPEQDLLRCQVSYTPPSSVKPQSCAARLALNWNS